jgi:pimeloyl-ACP methyl ester carboxylesterase
VHAADDTFAPYQHAVAAADRIPGVEFVTIDKGGHLFLGREAAVREAVAGFLGSGRVAPGQTSGRAPARQV